MVTARAGLPVEPTEAEQAAATSGEATPAAADPAPTVGSRCSSLWAAMLARIYEVFPLVCAKCGNEMRIISFITRPDAIERILSHIGEETTPPLIAPARASTLRSRATAEDGPPSTVSDLDQTSAYDFAAAEPVPDLDLDQTASY